MNNKFVLIPLVLLMGCVSPNRPSSQQSISLTAARRNFQTVIMPQRSPAEPVEVAPANIFKTIKYPSPGGELAAYLSPSPSDGKKHPAIIWITGGDCNSIGDVWSPASPANDQTGGAFRKAGIVMMFPSLRGGNNNPGTKEGFFGEVDDVLAAVKYLEKQDYVDPQRIYLGGHSTGGTLALLVAESSDRFRSVFAFGPVADVSGYGQDSGLLPFDMANRQEVKLRSPGYWLAGIKSPTWVLEGTKGNSNTEALRAMAKVSTNPQAHFVEITGADHFSVLAPTNAILAQKIRQDTGEVSNINISKTEVDRSFQP
jgi:acetyl esterase/lipase